MIKQLQVQNEQIADLCRRHHIRKLAVFGSVLRDDFRPESDIDLLVEFEPGQGVGFIGLGLIEDELSGLLDNRPIDLVTPKFLNPRIRTQILNTAQVLYEEA
jgi:hypothetical protein